MKGSIRLTYFIKKIKLLSIKQKSNNQKSGEIFKESKQFKEFFRELSLKMALNLKYIAEL